MLLNSIILILQETLEAALLISTLLAINYQTRHARSWFLLSLCGGIILAFVYALTLSDISTWWDYTGQEVINALLHCLVATSLIIFTYYFFNHTADKKKFSTMLFISASAAVILTITREGAEIVMYLKGFFGQSNHLSAVLMGSSIGLGIGISIGILLFYSLAAITTILRIRISILLLAVFTGNMLSQAVLQLTQADYITASSIVWNSSTMLSEQSLLGQLLYALIGYEATPSLIQILAYLLGFLIIIITSASTALRHQLKHRQFTATR